MVVISFKIQDVLGITREHYLADVNGKPLLKAASTFEPWLVAMMNRFQMRCLAIFFGKPSESIHSFKVELWFRHVSAPTHMRFVLRIYMYILAPN